MRSFLSERPKPRAFIPAVLYALTSGLLSALYWMDPAFKANWGANLHLVFDQWEWYRLLTSMMLHSDIRHFASNMMFLIPFGGLLTFYFGKRMFPLLALMLGIATHALTLMNYPLNVFLLGSSGLLYAMFGLWLSLYYKVETHIPTAKRWLRVLGFGLVMFIPSQFKANVSYQAHFIGLVLGLVSGLVYAKIYAEEFRRRNEPYMEAARFSEDDDHEGRTLH